LENIINLKNNNMSKLTNKVAVVTGGNSGIGYTTAEHFIAEGAKVVITGRNEASLKDAAAKLGNGTQYLVSDAGNLEHNLKFAADLKAIGVDKVDVLFYNAGVAQFAPAEQMPVEIYENNLNINFRGAFFTTQSLAPIFNEGGSIIFNTSVLATRTMAGNSAYGASKAALTSLASTLAVELAGRNIRVNSLSPGNISTPIYDKLGMNEQELQAFAASFIPKIPAARFGQPQEIAKAAVFLASSDSTYVTGSVLTVDGGTGVQW
jgi:NAD(P)-dependent dehydrogenase (short-subunit alcohol dehydrogenase family)